MYTTIYGKSIVAVTTFLPKLT